MTSDTHSIVCEDTDISDSAAAGRTNSVTVVIPAYNEEAMIGQVVRVAREFTNEVIVVDDGSEDRTGEAASAAGASVIRIPANTGKGNALSIGMSTAVLKGRDAVVCLDGDGQHNPADIPEVVRPILEDTADMVIGSRFLTKETRSLIPIYRKIGQKILTSATNLGSPVKITDSQSGFRAFSKNVMKTFTYSEKGMGIESEMIREAVKSGARIREVPISVRYKGLETSTYRPGNHGMQVLSSIIRAVRSERPLLYFGVSGTIMTIGGIVVGLYSFQYYTQFGNLPFGPTILAVVITVLGILFVLVGLILNAISELVKDRNASDGGSRH